MSNQTTIRLGGLVAILAALLLVIGAFLRVTGISQQSFDTAAVGQWVYLAGLAIVLLGLTALYAVQASSIGILGLAGYVLSTLGLALSIADSFNWIPFLKGLPAGQELLIYSARGFFQVSALLALTGLVFFGFASTRGGIFSRWPGILLVVGEIVAVGASYIPFLNPIWPYATGLVCLAIAWMGWTTWMRKPA